MIKAIETSILLNIDKHQPFIEMLAHKHKAYMTIADWVMWNIFAANEVTSFLGVCIEPFMHKRLYQVGAPVCFTVD